MSPIVLLTFAEEAQEPQCLPWMFHGLFIGFAWIFRLPALHGSPMVPSPFPAMGPPHPLRGVRRGHPLHRAEGMSPLRQTELLHGCMGFRGRDTPSPLLRPYGLGGPLAADAHVVCRSERLNCCTVAWDSGGEIPPPPCFGHMDIAHVDKAMHRFPAWLPLVVGTSSVSLGRSSAPGPRWAPPKQQGSHGAMASCVIDILTALLLCVIM